MNNKFVAHSLAMVTCLLLLATLPTTLHAKGYGKVIGKFVFKGKVPKVKMLLQKGDRRLSMSKKAFANGIKDQTLIIDPKTKGIKNMVIYIKKFDTKLIHPKLVKSKVKQVNSVQNDFQFQSHILSVRTDQKVNVFTNDTWVYNVHTVPIRQKGNNMLINPNAQARGVTMQYNRSEPFPMTVKDDIHNWMKSYWVVLDHPYSVITKADGTFEIDLLPEGKHKFAAWHEKRGYVTVKSKTVTSTRKGFNVDVKKDKTIDLGTIELTIKDLTK